VLDAAQRYAEHLTQADLVLLGSAVEVPPERAAAVLRSRGDLLQAALGAPETFQRVFRSGDEAFVRASPFLVFAVAVHQALRELSQARFVEERVGGQLRVPVFDVESLREYGDEPARRIFTIELLASYTTVASGPIWSRHGRRWRRQRFSELDPARMAAVVDAVPDSDRPGLYRRLGDLSLFLTGVFPDYTAHRAVSPLERERLLRSVQHLGPTEIEDVAQLSGTANALLGWLGPRWYELAASRTPLASVAQLLRDITSHFDAARRFLNVVTDRYLFPARGRLFPPPGS
jgi:hypothetical protein